MVGIINSLIVIIINSQSVCLFISLALFSFIFTGRTFPKKGQRVVVHYVGKKCRGFWDRREPVKSGSLVVRKSAFIELNSGTTIKLFKLTNWLLLLVSIDANA